MPFFESVAPYLPGLVTFGADEDDIAINGWVVQYVQVQQFNEMLDSLAGWSIWRACRLGAKCF
ncbi:hypothetical protein [Mycobacteroides abscessus]|uniref:hypothetical protein n=1 Tax=Mycobacteroides abscessus TaxID=36809 RepID=UPI000DD6F3FA|nr:hypothetical protein [Mycobacteroides abscessus]